MTTDLARADLEGAPIDTALALLADASLSAEDRGAVYALLHQIQLRINRVLRKHKDDLIVHMESNGLKQMGPLSVKATAFDVTWPVNEEGNWGDDGVQQQLAVMHRASPEYIREVPHHYEVRTAELGAGVASGDPVARELHRQMKDAGWRREGGRRLSLAVKEARDAA